MKPATIQPYDELGRFIREQTPPAVFPKALDVVGLRPAGGYESHHRIPAHGEQDDRNVPVIDTGHLPRIHDRIRVPPGLFARTLARLKFSSFRDGHEIPEYLRHQKD